MEAFIAQARQDLSGSEISTSALVRVGVALAVRVNAFVGLKGVEKRELVVKTILTVLEEKRASVLKVASEQGLPTKSIDEHYSLLMIVAKDAVPAAIDAAVAAARGSLNLKKVVPARFLSWFVCGLNRLVVAMNQADQLREEMKNVAPVLVAHPSSVELVIRSVEKIADVVVPVVVPEVPVVVPEVPVVVPEVPVVVPQLPVVVPEVPQVLALPVVSIEETKSQIQSETETK